MSNLNKIFNKREATTDKQSTSSKYNALQMAKMVSKTENGDKCFNTTGNKLLDIFFMSEYFATHLNELRIGSSDRDKLFSMLIRDPRFGLGRRDLGRELMKLSEVSAEDVVKGGRFDDLLYNPIDANINYLRTLVESGNELAKKWCPRLSSKDNAAARALAQMWFPRMHPQTAYKLYRKLIKVDTTENKLSRHREDEIEFQHVPSLAMIKYFRAFTRKLPEKFKAYTDSVKKGEAKLNIATTNVYDIYKARGELDAQMFFDKLDKISISCLPIIDTSGSMNNRFDSMGKALAIGHYLSKCSSYETNKAIAFSSNPTLIEMGKTRDTSGRSIMSVYDCGFKPNYNTSDYINEINSLKTGDCSNTDFGRVIELLSGLDQGPDWFVVLSDMEFDGGSSHSKDQTMKLFKNKGIKTKIVWWNLTDGRAKTVPELDEYGNVFISGYSPQMLQYLESGFDGEAFLNKLLDKYKEKINK